jgi:hypothetical protein
VEVRVKAWFGLDNNSHISLTFFLASEGDREEEKVKKKDLFEVDEKGDR